MSVQKIAVNTLLQSGGKIISVTIGLVTVGVLTRYLGDEGFGKYTTVIAFMGFFGILADLGLYLVTVKEISQKGADEKMILGNVFSLRFLTVVSLLLFGATVALFFPYPPEVKEAMFLGILAFLFVSGTQILVGVFQKYLIFYKLTASEIIQKLVMLGLVVAFARAQLGLIYFILALTLANSVHFFISLTIARRLIPFRMRFDFWFWKQILSKSWPLGFSVVLNLIYFRADTLILSYFKPAADVGVYGLSYKILEVLMAFPAMFAGLIMPFLARYAFNAWEKYKVYLQKSFDAMLVAIVPMIVVTLFFARPIIDLVGGRGFADADEVLKILIFATAIIYLGNLLGYTVVALNVQKKMLWGYLMGSIAGLILYFLLIPRFSYFGAAISTVAVELIVLTYAYFLTSQTANFFPSFRVLVKAIPAAIPMVALFQYIHLPWIVEIGIGLVVYLALLIVTRAIPKDFFKLLTKTKQEISP